jgi:hypothetical protein
MDAQRMAADAWNRLRDTLSTPRLRRLALLAGTAYALIYLYALGHVVISPGSNPLPGGGVFFATSLDNLWKERAPYNYEPVAAFQPVQGFVIFLAVPNLILAAILGLLLGLNIASAVHAYTAVKACGVKNSFSTLGASVPAFLTGFACCAPTFLILLGAAFAASLLALLPFFIPTAIAALLAGLLWNLMRPMPSPHPRAG